MNNLFNVNNNYENPNIDVIDQKQNNINIIKNFEQKNDFKKIHIKHMYQNNINMDDRIKKIKEQLDKLSSYDNEDDNNIYK